MLILLPATAVGVWGIVVSWRRGRGTAAAPGQRDRLWFLIPCWVAMVGSAWSGRVHSGGFDNVLLPAMAVTAVIVGIGVGELLRAAPTGERVDAHPARSRWAIGLATILVLGQFGLLVYNPADELPPASDVGRTDSLIATLRTLPGPVYLPGHGWYLARAGRPTGVQGAALADVLRGPDGEGRQRLRRQLETMIRQQRFGSVVVDSPRLYSYLPPDFNRYYCWDRRTYPTGRLLPIVGDAHQPPSRCGCPVRCRPGRIARGSSL